jgi:hypothetical protein
MSVKKKTRKAAAKKPTKRQLLKELGLLPEKENKPRINRKKLALNIHDMRTNRKVSMSEAGHFFACVDSFFTSRLHSKATRGGNFLEGKAITDEELGMLKVLTAFYNVAHVLQQEGPITNGDLFEALEFSLDGRLLCLEGKS